MKSTVPSRPITRKPPVRIDKPAEPASRVKVQVVGQKSITSKAQGPGEVAGPAVRFTIKVTNGTDAAISLDGVNVNCFDTSGNPALGIMSDPADPFSGSLAAGKSTTGVYVFNISKSARGKVRLEMALSADLPIVVFQGKAV